MKEFIYIFFVEIISPWLKKIFNYDPLKWSRMKEFIKNFVEIISPWLKKILNFHPIKCSRMKELSKKFLWNNFTMVEQNFEFLSFEKLQNEGIYLKICRNNLEEWFFFFSFSSSYCVLSTRVFITHMKTRFKPLGE